MSGTTTDKPAIGALAPWFGSNRILAPQVGASLGYCDWVGVPFLGGGAELVRIRARTIVANDLHQHIINLANVLRHPHLGPMLIRDLRRLPFHVDQLRHSQEHMVRVETRGLADEPETDGMATAYADALNYFVCCWMGRSAKAGTPGEFSGGLPVRWSAGGGDSAVRYRSAVESLRDWRRLLARCNFVRMDAFDFLDHCQDRPGHGIYCDPPFPGPGDKYTHRFTEPQQRQLADRLSAYESARVVCRFYDHPLIRELYPEGRWHWLRPDGGRTQANATAPEVLICSPQPRKATRP